MSEMMKMMEDKPEMKKEMMKGMMAKAKNDDAMMSDMCKSMMDNPEMMKMMEKMKAEKMDMSKMKGMDKNLINILNSKAVFNSKTIQL
jgi:hypothetical protein